MALRDRDFGGVRLEERPVTSPLPASTSFMSSVPRSKRTGINATPEGWGRAAPRDFTAPYSALRPSKTWRRWSESKALRMFSSSWASSSA